MIDEQTVRLPLQHVHDDRTTAERYKGKPIGYVLDWAIDEELMEPDDMKLVEKLSELCPVTSWDWNDEEWRVIKKYSEQCLTRLVVMLKE